jgi:hypothetical protein
MIIHDAKRDVFIPKFPGCGRSVKLPSCKTWLDAAMAYDAYGRAKFGEHFGRNEPDSLAALSRMMHSWHLAEDADETGEAEFTEDIPSTA